MGTAHSTPLKVVHGAVAGGLAGVALGPAGILGGAVGGGLGALCGPDSPDHAKFVCKDGELIKATKRSQLFIQLIEKYDSATMASADQGVKQFDGGTLSKEPQLRKKQLVKLYTGNTMYGPMNKCLLNDDKPTMKQLAGFIKELRDVFLTDDPSPIVVPYKGCVYRGINVTNPKTMLQALRCGEEFVWASFTSTSVSKPFSGNVQFEIKCSLSPSGQAFFVPASVAKLSQYAAETEVLFPPHVRFRVVNISGSCVQLETVEYPSVWEMIEKKDWESFQDWAKANNERVNTKECTFSLINKVAENWVDSPTGHFDPLQVCVEHHADINEEDKQSGSTPLIIAAKAAKQAGGVSDKTSTKVLEWCLAAGAKADMQTSTGLNATDILPEIKSIAQTITPKKFRWDYYVHDNIDGKSNGWYPYNKGAWPNVEEAYDAWRFTKAKDETHVKSKGDAGTSYTYAVNFKSMKQVNTSTSKTRDIRRVPLFDSHNMP